MMSRSQPAIPTKTATETANNSEVLILFLMVISPNFIVVHPLGGVKFVRNSAEPNYPLNLVHGSTKIDILAVPRRAYR